MAVKSRPLDSKTKQEFYFVYGNHGEAPTQMEDFYEHLQQMVLFCTGKTLRVSKEPVLGQWNFVVETFSDEFAKLIRRAKIKNRKTKFVCIVTEFMTGSTFNDFEAEAVDAEPRPILQNPHMGLKIHSLLDRACPQPTRDMLSRLSPDLYAPARSAFFKVVGRKKAVQTHYSDLIYWQNRYDMFESLAPCFDWIWCISPSQMKGYQEFLGGLDQLWLMPVIPFFANDATHPEPTLDIDFLFTGTVTGYRAAILSQLQKLGHSVVAGPSILPAGIRQNYLERSKICVHIKPSKNWRYSSNMRLHSLLMASKFIISEQAEDHVLQTDYVHHIPSDSFADRCAQLLLENDVVTRGRDAKQRYFDGTASDRSKTKHAFLEMMGD